MGLNIGKIPESIEAHVKDENRSAVVEKIVEDVMGPNCDVKKVPPLAVFRSSLKKTIAETVRDVRDGDMEAPIVRMDREWHVIGSPDFAETVGHELADEEAEDAQDAFKGAEATSINTADRWMNEAVGGCLEVGSDTINADPVKLLVWLLLFVLTGPIALIIWLVLLILARHDLTGI